MNTYPGFYRASNGLIYLYANKDNYYSFERETWDIDENKEVNLVYCRNEANITRECMVNTYGEVKSKEHAEFIVKLAEGAGFDVDEYHQADKWFCFSGNFLSFFTKEFGASDNKEKIITIPLPPKEPEPKEWPQVGDEVLTASKQKAKLIANHDYHAWVKYYEEDNTFSLGTVAIATLSKPPTPEEELAMALIEKYKHLDKREQVFAIARDIIDDAISKFSIKPE